jgi:sugar phosphate isomerase/epimerase
MKPLLKPLFFSFLFLSISFSMKAQEIALQMYSLRNEMKIDPTNYLQMIPTWGINALEGGGGYGYSETEYQKLLAENNLRTIGVGADYDQLEKDVQPIIDAAKRANAIYATCYWIPHTTGPISLEEGKKATELFNSAGAKLKEAGITLLYHPHGYEFAPAGKGVVMDYLLENAKDFSFNLDVYWIKMGGGDPLAMMKKYRGKFPVLHLKDREKGTANTKNGEGDVETNVVLGTGDIDIKGIILEAKKQGTDFLTIEDESSRSVSQIPQSVAYINMVLGRK